MAFGFKSRQNSSALTTVKKSLRKIKDNDTQRAEVMKEADRENYQYEQRDQELGTSNLVKSHKKGERFLYAAVTSKNQEDQGGLLRRLLQHQIKVQKTVIPVGDLHRIDLFDEVETFELENIISRKPGTFIHISEIIVVYGALISTDDVFSKVKISVIDDRKPKDKTATSFVANTNLCSRALLSLPYCFSRNEVNRITLTISRESAFLEPGIQWGAAQVMIKMEELTFPGQFSTSPTCAVNTIPESMLEDFEFNPKSIDLSVMNNDRKGLKDLYMESDLVDETTPISNKTENVKYAKSSLKDVKGKKVETQRTPDWEYINQRRISCNENENSVSVDDDGSLSVDSSIERLRIRALESERMRNESSSSSPPMKSAMKRSVRIEDPVLPIKHSI